MSTDVDYSKVTLLLKFDGSNGGTTFVDSSSTPKTLTATGALHTSNVLTPKYGIGSALFDSTGGNLKVTAANLFTGTGDFCIEGYFNIATIPTSTKNLTYYSASSKGFNLEITTAGKLALYVQEGNTYDIGINTVPLAAWNHWSVVRYATTFYVYLNGVLQTSRASSSSLVSGDLYIGSYNNTGNYFIGNMDSIRISNGIPRYTSNFTPPSVEFGNATHEAFPSSSIILTSTPITLFTINNWIINGIGFNAFLNPMVATIQGIGFDSAGTLIVDYGNVGDIQGFGFDSVATILGGSIIQGMGFDSVATIAIDAPEYAYIQGLGFDVFPSITIASSHDIAIQGYGFDCSAIMEGGATLQGIGFDCIPLISIDAPVSIVIQGYGFHCYADIEAVVPEFIQIQGSGFDAMLWYGDIQGIGFDVNPVINFYSTLVNAQALVMNMNTNEVTRFTNYPFSNIVRIADNYYGINSDGLYLINGDLDITAKINGSITLKDTDFGSFKSKRLRYVYLNSDTKTKVTPYVDNKKKTGQDSAFNGRKCTLGLGNNGRYWQLQIENIKNLQGVEFLPESLQRRVK